MFALDFGSRATVLLDEHNIEYELMYRMACAERALARKAYYWLEHRMLRHEERRSWQRADGCILTSAREEQILRRELPSKPSTVIPNGVDIDYFQPTDRAVDPNSIVFTGRIDYRPNTDAVIRFVQDILPPILQERPQVTFYVVGADAPDEILALAGPNVVVTGTVQDVRPYLERAAVVVVPLRMGGGTRLKVLDGLAMGKSMVTTALGCEGIDVRDGEHLLVANAAGDFARQVLRLMDDPELGARLGRNGRALVERQYGWASVTDRLESFYREMLEHKAAVGGQDAEVVGTSRGQDDQS